MYENYILYGSKVTYHTKYETYILYGSKLTHKAKDCGWTDTPENLHQSYPSLLSLNLCHSFQSRPQKAPTFFDKIYQYFAKQYWKLLIMITTILVLYLEINSFLRKSLPSISSSLFMTS